MVLKHLIEQIQEHQGSMPVELLMVTGINWAGYLLYAADEVGILVAEPRAPKYRLIVPWTNVAGVKWNTAG